MLLDGISPESLCQLIPPCSQCNNIAAQWGELATRSQEDRAEYLTPPDPSLRPADFSAEFGPEPADHLADSLAISPRSRRFGELKPGVVESGRPHLDRDEKLGIKRDG
jgi:hypothetical protein